MSSNVTGEVAKKLPRPNLINLHKRWLYKHVFISIAFGIVVGIVYKIKVTDVFERKTKEFYATYDPYADFERMRKLGIFSSCPPDDD